jgi:hypothetical protein
MPGPVSDSYDPEFGTGATAERLREQIELVRDRITTRAFKGDASLKNIIEVINGPTGNRLGCKLNEREWRIIRFCLNRALESI